MSASQGHLDQEHPCYQQTLANVNGAADAVEQGRIVTGRQLDELREATRRLRRNIETYSISASVPCPDCDKLIIPQTPDTPCCSDTHHASRPADPSVTSSG